MFRNAFVETETYSPQPHLVKVYFTSLAYQLYSEEIMSLPKPDSSCKCEAGTEKNPPPLTYVLLGNGGMKVQTFHGGQLQATVGRRELDKVGDFPDFRKNKKEHSTFRRVNGSEFGSVLVRVSCWEAGGVFYQLVVVPISTI
ncbi:hypothetical protein EDD18DRAFT_1098026 [Armillaria luteobubalina]|uniref:Uncharacterized protein n=1 Tax=Armillaria luteobubalina TaxID=153913 RepID=A0AA39QPJ1_9AGAR|nr:hypothetical protein EDD18DRAFT_1098026 [Armillaria luteobubalina]